jgi:hypothetical protein
VAFSPPGAYQSLSKHLYWNAKGLAISTR